MADGPSHKHHLYESSDPVWLDAYLKDNLYTFVGYDIARDKWILKKSGLEIDPNIFIDMQSKWRLPYTKKPYDSLADVACIVVHPLYKNMKNKITNKEDHKLWGIAPLPDYLMEYAIEDAYATYDCWKKIGMIKKDLSRLKYEKQFGNIYEY
ncbi:hypothetical protein D1007_34719 [Hordeum vulgare]|nr:hypothetical protein D1007_34719 [Hordeum vulgare]